MLDMAPAIRTAAINIRKVPIKRRSVLSLKLPSGLFLMLTESVSDRAYWFALTRKKNGCTAKIAISRFCRLGDKAHFEAADGNSTLLICHAWLPDFLGNTRGEKFER